MATWKQLEYLSLILAIVSAGWTFKNARMNQMLAWLWALLSLAFFPLGWLIYLLARGYNRQVERVVYADTRD